MTNGDDRAVCSTAPVVRCFHVDAGKSNERARVRAVQRASRAAAKSEAEAFSRSAANSEAEVSYSEGAEAEQREVIAFFEHVPPDVRARWGADVARELVWHARAGNMKKGASFWDCSPGDRSLPHKSRARLAAVIHFLRDAMAEAAATGTPQVGILVVNEMGQEGRVLASFNAPDFVKDLCDVLGLPRESTEEEKLDVAAVRMAQRIGGPR